MLGLGAKNKQAEWYTNWRDHPAKTIVDKKWDKKSKSWVPQRSHGKRINEEISKFPLTELQKSCNVYEPIEAYEEKWDHVESLEEDGVITILAFPIEGTRQRSDLPPLYQQWKTDWSRKNNARKRFR